MSFQDFQVLYLDYEMEELVGIDLYDMWENSNYPMYYNHDYDILHIISCYLHLYAFAAH